MESGCKSAKSSRRKKSAAYDVLIEKLKVLEPDATRDTVVKKINNLRSAFRKELKKVRESKSSGEVYVPLLWYFHELLFLVNGATEPNHPTHVDCQLSTLQDEVEDSDDSITTVPIASSSFMPYREKRKSDFASAQDLLQTVASFMDKDDDEFTILAKGYATKLRKLTPRQLMFADRLINEVLVDAQSDVLQRSSYVVHSETTNTTAEESIKCEPVG